MTQELMKIAKEAGIAISHRDEMDVVTYEDIKRFAELVAAPLNSQIEQLGAAIARQYSAAEEIAANAANMCARLTSEYGFLSEVQSATEAENVQLRALLDRLEKAEKDAARLDFLQEQSYKAPGLGWVARDSTTGRGYRLHQDAEGAVLVRVAIDKAMEASK